MYTYSTLIYFLPKSTSFPPKNNRNAPLNVCNSFLFRSFKVKVKLEPHEEQIFVDDDDEVSVSYIFLQGRLCFMVLKVYLFYLENNSSSEMWFLLVPFVWIVTQASGGSRGEAWGPFPPPPVIFGPNWGPKSWKRFCGDPPPPLPYLRVCMTAPPSPPYLKVWILHCRLTVTKISNFGV